jgi:hypothetical protein
MNSEDSISSRVTIRNGLGTHTKTGFVGSVAYSGVPGLLGVGHIFTRIGEVYTKCKGALCKVRLVSIFL